MATSPISTCPDEILHEILVQVKRISDSDQDIIQPELYHHQTLYQNDIFSCSLVNRRWNEQATSILYRHIVVNSDYVNFASRFNASKYGSFVRSVTITDDHIDDKLAEALDLDFNDQFPEPELVELLPQLTSLLSFSFKIIAPYPPQESDRHDQLWLMDLIEALPSSVTNLEIDTDGTDDLPAYMDWKDRPHLCDVIREVLPRMQHVRLRIGGACERLFVESYDPNELEDMQIMHLPNLRTLVINTSKARVDGQCCPCVRLKADRDSPLGPEFRWENAISVLEKVVSTPSALSKRAQIFIFETDMHRGHRGAGEKAFSHESHPRNDKIRKQTWAIPYRPNQHRFSVIQYLQRNRESVDVFPLPSSQELVSDFRNIQAFNAFVTVDESLHILRLPSGQQVMSSYLNIEAIAEGLLWRGVVGGARIPAVLLENERLVGPSFARGCVEVPMPIAIEAREGEIHLGWCHLTQFMVSGA